MPSPTVSKGLEADVEHSRQGIFIGEPLEPASGRYLPSFDPTIGEPWYELADAGFADVDKAVTVAGQAFRSPGWQRMTATERGELLFRLSDVVSEYTLELALLETRDIGKLLRETRALMLATARNFRFFGGMADKIRGSTVEVDQHDVLGMTLREPYGVVASIVPWNSPLYLLAGSLAPAIAAGNTVVAKPSPENSASIVAFARLAREAGLPAGVLNVVTGGATAGEALVSHPGVDKIAFTGGTEIGKRVAAAAAANITPVTLELGGKSPHVVCADADLDRAVLGVAAGIFAAAGQTCVAGSRCLVEQPVYEEVLERVKTLAEGIRIGDPRHEDTQLGPLGTLRHLESVSDRVAAARVAGCRLITGGEREPGRKGWFYQPTVFADVPADAELFQEELFAPVLAVTPFSGEDEMLSLANATRYGLAAGIWTRDIDRAMRFTRRVQAGTVWVNTYRAPSMTVPAGGYKQSGYGRQEALEGMLEYTQLKSVLIDYSGTGLDPFVMKLSGTEPAMAEADVER
jgi:(Z)-2-((N-methylformamido)methylene)-5-hydroxybutyrolactone dehydrogenase